jgi:hypothetical protein
MSHKIPFRQVPTKHLTNKNKKLGVVQAKQVGKVYDLECLHLVNEFPRRARHGAALTVDLEPIYGVANN